MATTFDSLYPFIRALLGDTDSRRVMYKDDAIDAHIRLRILAESNPVLQEDGESGTFTTELSATEKAKLIYRVAKALLSPAPDSFSYRTPIHSASRRGGVVQLMAYIDSELDALLGGSILLKTDSELNAILNAADRFYKDYSDALVE